MSSYRSILFVENRVKFFFCSYVNCFNASIRIKEKWKFHLNRNCTTQKLYDVVIVRCIRMLHDQMVWLMQWVIQQMILCHSIICSPVSSWFLHHRKSLVLWWNDITRQRSVTKRSKSRTSVPIRQTEISHFDHFTGTWKNRKTAQYLKWLEFDRYFGWNLSAYMQYQKYPLRFSTLFIGKWR